MLTQDAIPMKLKYVPESYSLKGSLESYKRKQIHTIRVSIFNSAPLTPEDFGRLMLEHGVEV